MTKRDISIAVIVVAGIWVLLAAAALAAGWALLALVWFVGAVITVFAIPRAIRRSNLGDTRRAELEHELHALIASARANSPTAG
jgi:hypothetical protein